MVKQNDDYQCVPPERVAQLLSLGVCYEGYVEFKEGQKIFVNISPHDHIMTSPKHSPQDSILSVHVLNSANPLLVDQEKHWSAQALKGVQIANGGVGLAVGAIEHFGPNGTMRFTKGGKFALHYYGSGWKGGSPAKIRTYKITTIAKTIGKRSFLIGIPIEIMQSATGNQPWMKSSVNIAFSAIGVWGGPVGWVISGLYFGLDLVGAFDSPSHILPVSKDPMERYAHPADATRVEHIRPIERIPHKKPQFIPREQPILKQGYKK